VGNAGRHILGVQLSNGAFQKKKAERKKKNKKEEKRKKKKRNTYTLAMQVDDTALAPGGFRALAIAFA
jgi:hypothetical protein